MDRVTREDKRRLTQISSWVHSVLCALADTVFVVALLLFLGADTVYILAENCVFLADMVYISLG